jgi:hypothetical protein
MSTEEAAFELHLTRDFTAAEQRDLLNLWRRLLWPDGAGRWFASAWYLCYGFAGFLVLSLWMSVDQLASVAPRLAVQLTIAAIGFAMTFALLQWISVRLHRNTYWQAMSVGDRFVIELGGIRGIGQHSDGLCRWSSIEHLVCTDRYIAFNCKGRGLLLAKAAFADQDVEGFCAELQRRWNAAREQIA